MPMKKLRKTLEVVAINLALLVVLVEATSIAAYFFQTGSFFYGHSGNRKIVGLTVAAAATTEGSNQAATIQQLHPILVLSTELAWDTVFHFHK